MVQTLSTVPETTNINLQTLPRIVELVGPAGSGKTTLSRALLQQQERLTVMGLDIELRRPQDLPRVLRTMPTILPLLLQRGNRRYSWDEVKTLAYASGWHTIFQQQAKDASALVLLDHGPVFRMAKLYTYGPRQLHESVAKPWWDKMFRQWGATLDMVIWLDAPNQILEERIQNRNQRHVLKGQSGIAVAEFLDNYRRTYEFMLDRLHTEHGLNVVRFDTSQMSLEQVIHNVKKLCIG